MMSIADIPPRDMFFQCLSQTEEDDYFGALKRENVSGLTTTS